MPRSILVFSGRYHIISNASLVKNCILSYDVASGSEITPCNKMDKPLVVYRFSGKVMKSVNNVAYIMTNFYLFHARNEISK